MLNTLSYIGDKLNKSNILWWVGSSILLNQYSLIDTPNYIDIFIDINDINRDDEILKDIGKRKIEKKILHTQQNIFMNTW